MIRTPSLRPSHIADLLKFLTYAPFHGEMLRCWPRRVQARCENWANFEVHRLIIADLDSWPVGHPCKLPYQAENFIVISGLGNMRRKSVKRIEELRVWEKRIR